MDRTVELLLKGLRRLSEAEQDEVVGALLTSGLHGDPAERRAAGLPLLSSAWVPSHPPVPDTGGWKVLPVRLPEADYERLRAWSRDQGFSMAVVIRTLVERFLDERVPRATGVAPDPAA
jgi:hypothetical protein